MRVSFCIEGDMRNAVSDAHNQLFRRLPQVGEFLETGAGRELLRAYPRPLVMEAVRTSMDRLRAEIGQGALAEEDVDARVAELAERVSGVLRDAGQGALRSVINATGVILQTNLGRAPLSAHAVQTVAEVASGYCNLEFDLASGARGKRGAHVERLLLQAVGLDPTRFAALVVNNCAAATLLALNSIAEDGEVIVSRGELVEIGGGFRVPEILRKSGARLVEVGTTNRTRIEDYAAAITAQTKLLLRVHRSNFEIVGFTEEAGLSALVELGSKAGVPVFVDQGTGCVISPETYGLGAQSTLVDAVKSGAALVSASADKLLGGPQCGLMVGERNLIERLRGNPLYRALRVDKMTIAALQETLLAYLSNEAETIPAIRMLAMSADCVRTRCEAVVEALGGEAIGANVIATESVVGGGTTPGTTLASFAVALEMRGITADELAGRLRRLDPPVIGRIQQERVLLDLRTVPENLDELLIRLLSECLGVARA
jgi:L-seryl-tRNA(Ser) seleniumtransferase